MNNYHLKSLDTCPASVSAWSSATPFHSEQWSKLMLASLGIETQHTTLMDGKTLMGYLPYRFGGLFGGKIQSGPALANYCPSLIFDESIKRESAVVYDVLAKQHPDAVLLSSSGTQSATSIFNLDMSGNFETYWHRVVHAKAKYDVRKADKHKITTEFSGPEACEIFYSLYLKRMKELGSPALPNKFFHLLAKHFDGNFRFAVSYKDQRPVAASTLLSWNNRWIGHPWSVSDSAFRHISVNYAHYRDLIKYAFNNGYTRFYLGPSLKNSNWSRIKLRFGGEESFAVRLDGKANPHAADSALVQTTQSVIRRMPAPLFRFTSPLITNVALRVLG